jgi:hypothetical protein
MEAPRRRQPDQPAPRLRRALAGADEQGDREDRDPHWVTKKKPMHISSCVPSPQLRSRGATG